jgi:chemotaxis family two-component system response regulator Rcp1
MTRSPRLLVVEDNEGDVRLVQEALKHCKSPCELTVAKDGIQAIALLSGESGFAAPPDLILLDLNLPFKDGREVLSEIKKDDQLKHIPVLVFTSSRSPDDVLSAYRLHANCYLSKPARLDEFFDLVASIEEFWTRLAQLPALA